MTEENLEPLPRAPGLWAKAHPGEHGLTEREVAQLSRQDRAYMRAQALDDQMFAACLAAFGGDERTARIYWLAGRDVAALCVPRAWWGIRNPQQMVDFLRENYPEWGRAGDE